MKKTNKFFKYLITALTIFVVFLMHDLRSLAQDPEPGLTVEEQHNIERAFTEDVLLSSLVELEYYTRLGTYFQPNSTCGQLADYLDSAEEIEGDFYQYFRQGYFLEDLSPLYDDLLDISIMVIEDQAEIKNYLLYLRDIEFLKNKYGNYIDQPYINKHLNNFEKTARALIYHCQLLSQEKIKAADSEISESDPKVKNLYENLNKQLPFKKAYYLNDFRKSDYAFCSKIDQSSQDYFRFSGSLLPLETELNSDVPYVMNSRKGYVMARELFHSTCLAKYNREIDFYLTSVVRSRANLPSFKDGSERDKQRIKKVKSLANALANAADDGPGEVIRGCEQADAKTILCQGNHLGGSFGNSFDPLQPYQACNADSQRICQYSISKSDGSAGATSSDFQICFYLEEDADGLDSGLQAIRKDQQFGECQ